MAPLTLTEKGRRAAGLNREAGETQWSTARRLKFVSR